VYSIFCQTSTGVTTHSVWPAQPVAQFLSAAAVPASGTESPSLCMKGQFCGEVAWKGPATTQNPAPEKFFEYHTSKTHNHRGTVDGAKHKTDILPEY